MNSISLNGSWELWYYPEGVGVQPQTPAELEASGHPRIPARVPGNVEIDLEAAGVEPDPFFGANIDRYHKYEFYSWWYVREFDLPEMPSGDPILSFSGCDTYARVWVNGEMIGSCDDMLIAHEFDLAAALRPGKNRIAVHIASALNVARGCEFPVGAIVGEKQGDEFTVLRKAPSMFGWDIMPRLVSAGLWKDVSIHWRPKTYIKEVYYAARSIGPYSAGLHCRYRFMTDDPFIEGFTVRITASLEGRTVAVKESRAPFVSGKTNMDIPDPVLWWPKGYGEPVLYDLTLELLHGGQVVASRSERFGIRKVEIERAYGAVDQQQFLVKVNDTPIMIKGTNWVPLDPLHSRDIDRLPAAHALLDDIGCNMVRCWGGNVYESDDFYELCDQRGILVWQDFTFACALYSQYDDFARVIEREAAAVIIRLRNHACLALWAGDNELDAFYISYGQLLPHSRDNRISRETLPRAIMMHDPYRDYLPSSPYVPPESVDYDDVPEQHPWGPRDYFKGEYYKNHTARFTSEIGYHGCPAVSSIKRFIPAEELSPLGGSEAWRAHNTDFLIADARDYDRNQLMRDQVAVLFGEVPDALEEFALLSQISQAEAKKFFIESTRIKKWRRTGILWWNLLDGWPQISDAVVDYYFRKKIAYHYIKRVSGKTLLMMGESEAWKHRLVLCNDSREDFEARYRVVDGDTGETLASGQAVSRANENLELPPLPSIPGQQRLYLLHWEINGEAFGNHYISGFVPVDAARMKAWLLKIEALPMGFSARECVG